MPYYRCSACGLTSYGSPGYSTATVCPNCAEPLRDDARLYLVPGASVHVARALPARAQSVADARRTVHALPLPEDTRRTAALLVSELVTNAIRHGGRRDAAAVELSIANSAGRVRVAVHDTGDGFAAPAQNGHAPLSVGGQGLPIVAALSDAWGIDRNGDGCTVWCELATR